jgi:voltage-gated potassium channel
MATSSITGIGEVERRDLVAAGLRAALSTGVLVLAYCLVPVSARHLHHGLAFDVGALARIGVAVAIFIVVLTLEIRAITRAKHPMLRAGVAMAVVIPLFLLFFAWTYVTVSASNPHNFGGPLDKIQAFYFTVTIFSTVGFGDITPKTDLARLLTTFQMLADLAVIAIVIRLILGVAKESTADARAAQATAADAFPATGEDAAPTT